jgi:3-oxoadipate enol-lactonase
VPTAQVNGITVYYEQHGAGTPLLLIGGLGADLTLFANVTRSFAEHHQVVTFDNRGAGRTDKPDEPYSMELMAQDTVGLLDALSIDHAHVLGVSMGGRIALELAIRHPARVDRLVLVSTSAASHGKLAMSLPTRALKPLKKLGLLRSKHPQPAYAHERQRAASAGYNGVDHLDQIRAPTRILHGRDDKSMPLESAERMQAGIAGARLDVFRGGHMFFLLSQWEEFVARVVAFLASR